MIRLTTVQGAHSIAREMRSEDSVVFIRRPRISPRGQKKCWLKSKNRNFVKDVPGGRGRGTIVRKLSYLPFANKGRGPENSLVLRARTSYVDSPQWACRRSSEPDNVDDDSSVTPASPLPPAPTRSDGKIHEKSLCICKHETRGQNDTARRLGQENYADDP